MDLRNDSTTEPGIFYLFGIFNLCQCQRGCIRQRMFRRQNSLLPCIYQKIRLCFLLPCAFTKEKPHCYIINADQIFHIYYRTSCTDYSILILSPIPPQKFCLPPTSRSRADGRLQQTRKVCLHFPVRHAFVHAIEK